MKGILKWPLIIAAIFVIARVILEQAGAPGGITSLVSVVVLYVLVFPLYFAIRIANSDQSRPYRLQLRLTALDAVLCRSMVIPTY